MAYSKIKGLTVEINGDTTKLGNALETVNKKSSELQKELNSVNKLLKFDASNVTLLKQKQDILTESIKNTEDKLQRLHEAQKNIDDLYKKGEIDSGQYREFQRELTATEQKFEKLQIELSDTQEEIRKTTNGIEDLGDESEKTGNKAEQSSEGFTVLKGVIADLTSKVISKGIEELKKFGQAVYDAGTNFQTSMSQVAAVSGATGNELNKLTEKAKEMGAKTKFSASESADAFNYMAMAGWKTEDMLNGIEGIMNLAAASGADLATTSDIVTDALTAMGYSAKDAGRLADVMAASSSNANTNVEMMGQTFKYAAPVVGALGYSMEDTAIAIGLMANSGIKAEQAGTSLRSVLSRLAAPTDSVQVAMDKLNISLTNTDGTMKPLNTLLINMRESFSKLNEVQKSEYASTIAGKNAMSGLLAIVNSTQSDVDKLTNAVNNSSGAAQNMADIMQDNLEGEMTIFKSQLEGVYIRLYEKLEPSIRKAIKSLKELIDKIDWSKFGDNAKKALDKVMDGLNWIVKNRNLVINALKLVIAAFAIKKINSWTKSMSDVTKSFLDLVKNAKASATTLTTSASVTGTVTGATKGLTTAQNLLNAAFKANPVGVVVTALWGLYEICKLLIGKTNELSEAQKKEQEELNNMREKLDENKTSWDNLKEAQQKAIDAGMTEMSYYENLADELDDLVDKNGKIKEGYEDRASFIVSTLNDALGTEISITEGVISKYDELKNSIQDVIDKKKAQIILDSQEDLYKEALNNQSSAIQDLIDWENKLNDKKEEVTNLQKERNELVTKWENEHNQMFKNAIRGEILAIDDRIAKLKEETSNIENDYNEQKNLVEEYAYNIGLYEKNMALAHAGNYEEMSTVTWNLLKEYQNADNAEKAMLDDKIKYQKEWLEVLKSMRNENNQDIIDTQIATAEKELQNLEDNLKKYSSTTDEKLKEVNNIWSHNLDEQLSEITGRNIQFKEDGQGNIQMYTDGIAISKSLPKDEMAKVVEETILEISKQETGAEDAGKSLLEGIYKGIGNQNKQTSIFGRIATFGSNLLRKLKESLDEHSPSKATQEMGEFLDEGLEVGVLSEEKSVLNKVSKFGENVLSALKDELSDTVGINTEFNGTRNLMLNTLTKSNPNSSVSTTANDVQKLTNLMERYLPAILNNMGYDVILDGKKVSQAIAPEMNKQFGILTAKERRGY